MVKGLLVRHWAFGGVQGNVDGTFSCRGRLAREERKGFGHSCGHWGDGLLRRQEHSHAGI